MCSPAALRNRCGRSLPRRRWRRCAPAPAWSCRSPRWSADSGRWGTNGSLALPTVQIVDPRLLRVVVTDHQVLAVEGEGDLRGRGGRLEGRDLRIAGAVEHQHLIGILSHDVEAVAHGVGQQIGQVSREIDDVPR